MDEVLRTSLKEMTSWTKEHVPALSPDLDYKEMSTEQASGLYIVYHKGTAIYVGKTSRSGRIRVREMGSDYRSHTLNRKLLLLALHKAGIDLDRALTKDSKKDLIASGKITAEVFRKMQSAINKSVRTVLRFQFIACDQKELSRAEHWLIGLLNPMFND